MHFSKNANSNPSVDGQRMNSDKFYARADEFGRRRVIARVLVKKKKSNPSGWIAIASGRVRTSCNFHAVHRPSLRTSSDEFQTRPDSFGLTAKSSGRVRTSFKLLHPKTQDSRRNRMSCNFVRISSNEIIATSTPPSVDRRRTSSEMFQNRPDQFRKTANSSGRRKLKSEKL